MPQLLKHIDKIAREQQRDVLFLKFEDDLYPERDYHTWQTRIDVIAWLEQNAMGYFECFGLANEHGIAPYDGTLYLDVNYDDTDATYIKLRDYLEHSDGTSRFEGMMFCCLPLKIAMQNRHHDAPDFWDKWAEDF